MASVSAVVLHPQAPAAAGPLERGLADARLVLGRRLADRLAAAGADRVAVIDGPADGTPFGARLRSIVRTVVPPGHGLIIAGSGSAAMARPRDLAPFVALAASGARRAAANNRFSADVVALGDPTVVADAPDLPADNALPRWLEEVAGVPIEERPTAWRLAIDVDSPLDLVLLGRADLPGTETAREALRGVAAALADRRAEVLVAGRSSARTLRRLERGSAARIRALVEERGLRASSSLALATAPGERALRPPASLLGMLLEDRGPEDLARVVERVADAAVVDTRVLLAARLGVDERRWPSAEDRFASDLLLAERIADPWLRELTAAARAAPIPIVLGGHTLVGPGLKLLLGAPWRPRAGSRRR